MIYRTIITITITVLIAFGLLAHSSLAVFRNPAAAQTTTRARLTLTDAVISDANIPPNLMQVSWNLTGLQEGDRVEKYRLIVRLSANRQEGEVVQTPSPNLKTVSVGLLGIPQEVRTKIFTGGQIVSARITLAATIIHRGARQEIFATLQKGFPVQSTSPKPRPTPNREEPREGQLKRKTRTLDRN